MFLAEVEVAKLAGNGVVAQGGEGGAQHRPHRQRDHGTDHHDVASVIIPRCVAGAKLMDGETAPSFLDFVSRGCIFDRVRTGALDDLPPRSAGLVAVAAEGTYAKLEQGFGATLRRVGTLQRLTLRRASPREEQIRGPGQASIAENPGWTGTRSRRAAVR